MNTRAEKPQRNSMAKVSRRDPIKTLGAAALTTGLPLAGVAAQEHATAPPARTPSAESGAAPGAAAAVTADNYLFFNSEEAAFVEAAVARLIPADEQWGGAIEAGVPNYIDKQVGSAWGALIVVASLLLGVATPAYPQASAPHQISSNELAKQVANPVTSLWSIQFQFNNFALESGKWAENLLFQPVLPVSLTKDVNLITRPVIPLYVSLPHPTATGEFERTTTFGDMILAEILSPANSGHWLLGAGPSFIFPTAHSDFTGQGKWQLGPAAVVGYLTDKFLVGAFAQQWWSYAGESDRRTTSHINIQPFARLFLGEGWSIGYSGNILADWKARDEDVWTVPIGVGISKIVKFGRLPVNLQIAGQYIPVRPQGGTEWNVQIQVTPVIPKLVKGTLFQ